MSGSAMEASERIHLHKKRRREVQFHVVSTIEIVETDPNDPSYEEVVVSETINSVTSQGLDEFLQLLAGTGGTAYDGSSYLRLTDGGGGTIQTFSGADAGPQNATATNSPGARREWVFEDNSTASYSFNNAQLFNGDPSGSGVQFNDFAFGSQQSKPSDRNWHYRVQIEIYSTDNDFTDAGMLRALQRLSGELPAPFDETNVTLQPRDSSTGDVGAAITPDSAPNVDTGADEVTFDFTSPNGDNEGDWDETQIKHDNSGSVINVRDGGCHDDGSSCGTKQQGEEWTYTWVFSFS